MKNLLIINKLNVISVLKGVSALDNAQQGFLEGAFNSIEISIKSWVSIAVLSQ